MNTNRDCFDIDTVRYKVTNLIHCYTTPKDISISVSSPQKAKHASVFHLCAIEIKTPVLGAGEYYAPCLHSISKQLFGLGIIVKVCLGLVGNFRLLHSTKLCRITELLYTSRKLVLRQSKTQSIDVEDGMTS